MLERTTVRQTMLKQKDQTDGQLNRRLVEPEIVRNMKLISFVVFFLGITLSAFSYTDESHYSLVFGRTRYFRVFTPSDYDETDFTKRYPVIYYFHGCGGSYRSSGPYSYAEFGLKAPVAIGRNEDSDYGFPNNADFENYSDENNVIIVCVDGKIYGLPTWCGVFFPSQAESWEGNYYNFSAYIRELIHVVDSRYHTKRGSQFRAVSGLSMGGHMAIWVAATNPHLFSSASEFCHSPSFFDVGNPAFQTTVDLQQLWRNLRGLPFRHSTNDGDYLKYYTEELSSTFSGAGFENEFYLADFCKHHAARVDLQFDFHLGHFSLPKTSIPCFSHINLYPLFEIWGYEVSSSKTGNGWIYLHSVTKNGFGIYTRKRLPWGNCLPEFDISITSPPVYSPGGIYTVSRYAYRDGAIRTHSIQADSNGRITLSSSGGMGEEIGLSGEGLQPPVFVLTDTINENIYLDNNVENALSFDVVNLSASSQEIDFIASSGDTALLQITQNHKHVRIPGLSKIRIDSLLICKGFYRSSFQNKGYIKIASSINGIIQDRDCILQVTVKNQPQQIEPSAIRILDGKSEHFSVFKYAWGEWNHPLSSDTISEGFGNGNGKAEMGETFSLWIKMPSGYDSLDIETWHPLIPINSDDNPDIQIKEIKLHRFSTGRSLLSAEICLKRKPTKENPIRIPVQSEFLKIEQLNDDCHRNVADNFAYYYSEIIIHEDGSAHLK